MYLLSDNLIIHFLIFSAQLLPRQDSLYSPPDLQVEGAGVVVDLVDDVRDLDVCGVVSTPPHSGLAAYDLSLDRGKRFTCKLLYEIFPLPQSKALKASLKFSLSCSCNEVLGNWRKQDSQVRNCEMKIFTEYKVLMFVVNFYSIDWPQIVVLGHI